VRFSIGWIELASLAGAVIGIFFSLVICGKKRRNRGSNYLLALFISVFSLLLFYDALGKFIVPYFPLLTGLVPPMVFAIGPLLFFYVRSLTNPQPAPMIKVIPHFIPLLLAIFVQMRFGFTTPLSLELLVVLRYLSLLVYLTGIIFVLEKYQSRLLGFSSWKEKINLAWLKYLAFAYISLVGISLLYSLLSTLWFDVSVKLQVFLRLSEPIVILAISYGGLRQELIVFGPETVEKVPLYLKSPLTPELIEAYKLKILEHMTRVKPYLNPAITLPELSRQLSLPSYLVSQVINESLQIKFFDFINSYRVEEAKRLLRSRRDDKLLKVAADSGFRSLATFYRMFKRKTGITPAEFR